MAGAELLTDGALPAVRLERILADPPQVVWEAITDREQLKKWFPCDIAVEGGRWVEGAAITFLFPEHVIDLTLTGTVLQVDEPRTLAFTWGEETLRFALSPQGDGTRLVLVDELPAAFAARNAAGWDDCLDLLEGIAPQGKWKENFEAYAEQFAPLVGAQEGPPA